MKLTLLHKHTEGGDIISFCFKPEKPLDWEAGQFMRWQIDVDGKPMDHWFTISSAPYEKKTCITTHARDTPFKQALKKLEVGDVIHGFGRDGDFVWQDSDLPHVFIAGGIGVTPFHSIIKQRAHVGQSLPVTLLYANRDDDIAFKAELDAIARAHPEFGLSYLVGKPLTVDIIKQKVPHILDSLVYLSGAEPMVEAIGDQLQKVGLPAHQLKRDFFPNYTAKTA
ncbi:MAG TPA: FAD-dependent oxidoreductase [Candidatus Saccharimonadales bacterium]|jgi:ferredoxin-NADP reductase|nr:FAD-dependent oxidoreductase [Candidatus Saccharimonadales bacterium]